MSNLYETWWKYIWIECFMLLEYQLDWIKIVDFLLIAKFLVIPENYDSPSSTAWAYKRVIIRSLYAKEHIAEVRKSCLIMNFLCHKHLKATSEKKMSSGFDWGLHEHGILQGNCVIFPISLGRLVHTTYTHQHEYNGRSLGYN